MKNIYRVTRPAWATVDKRERNVILFASFLVALYAGFGERFARMLIGSRVPEKLLRDSWPIVDVVVVTFGCIFIINIYKRLKVGRYYPRTFIYCFDMPVTSIRRGKARVVGFCYLIPDMDQGEITAKGASFQWDNGHLDPPTGFASTHVYGIEDKEEVTCNIRFDINSEDVSHRNYRRGLLTFRPATNSTATKDKDEYAGYLESTLTTLQDVEVKAYGYAEHYSRGIIPRDQLESILAGRGFQLFGTLDTMKNAATRPSLWEEKDQMVSSIRNKFELAIPTPQSVILDENLRPHVCDYLGKVLLLFGLDTAAIDRFKRIAVDKARVERADTLAYEEALKTHLSGKIVKDKEDEALYQRALVIYNEIEPYLTGESILDVGCGNGLISKLAKDRVPSRRIQLVDVVKYLPRGLNLPFAEYVEGRPLPGSESFDTVLLLTVLHHSKEPIDLLKLAWERTKRRLIIIESVVGIRHVTPPVKYVLVDSNNNDDQQIAYAAFIDWFYNRVLHDNVPVPYNFTKPETWQSIFSQCDMRCVQTIHLGQDIDIGPEYHILFVLEK